MEKTHGIYPAVNSKLGLFSGEERAIISMLARKYWLVTRAEKVQISRSEYKIILIKPNRDITTIFNLQREVIVVFSPYDKFMPRSIDAIEYLDIQGLRLEEICSIIISKDPEVEDGISKVIKTNQEARVIIPFSYEEFASHKDDDEFVINRIRDKFYSRDLFDIQDPLKKDIYFFGRTDLLYNLVNKHLKNENAGVFGLRKTGKTSILYGVERALDRKNSISVFIDCQTLHMKSWNEALFFIVRQLREKSRNVKERDIHSEQDYEKESSVMEFFEQDIINIYKKGKKKILLVFDEIENITFGTSISEGWKNGTDFVKFWQVLRSTYQKSTDGVFTYLITGTNPRCVEVPTIDSIDNPIFMQFKPQYIPAFDFSQTQEMVNKLGGYMGITFDESVCSCLVEDFGGHPLLIRQMCSFMHEKFKGERPHRVVKVEYEDLKQHFYTAESGFSKYAEMVLKVLNDWYNDEYQMLEWLSLDDFETFEGLAKLSPRYIEHLLRYGIIGVYNDKYYFKIEALKVFLQQRNRYKKLNLSNEEKQAEISKRRNRMEPKLRRIVKMQLQIHDGVEEATKKVVKEIYDTKEAKKHISDDYNDLFDPLKSKIYLKNLFDLISKNWDGVFKNIFGDNVETFKAKTTIINHYRKPDAHAATISEADFKSFRGAMEWLEDKVDNYYKMFS